jgi:type IV pilus assembly protein PilC
MPEFSFEARDSSGRPQSGVLAADNVSRLAAQLRGRGWIVMEISSAGSQTAGVGRLLAAASPMQWLPATRLDVEFGMQQLATMLRSGLTLLSALRTAAEQARRPRMARVWTLVAERIEGGSTFADALAVHGGLFPPMVVQLVRVGEESGTLDNVMKRAAMHLERSRMVKTTLLTSLMYPAFVLLAALGVTAFMVFSLIPKLQKFLAGRGKKLPQMSQMLLDGTNWINANATSILAVMLAILVSVVIVYRLPWGRARIDHGCLRVPIIGGVLRLAGTATVARGLSILLDSGITLLSALQTVRGLLSNRAMQARLETARGAVIEGSTLADPLIKGREFTPMLGRMTAVGEATGTLGMVLEEVADFHESQLAAAVRRLSALVEPATIIVVGGIVGFVYIAFFMALLSAAGGVK